MMRRIAIDKVRLTRSVRLSQSLPPHLRPNFYASGFDYFRPPAGLKMCVLLLVALILSFFSAPLVAQEITQLEKYNDTTSGGVNMIDGRPEWRSTDLVVDSDSPVAISISRRLVLSQKFPIESFTPSLSKAFAPEFRPFARCFTCDDAFGHVMTFYWFGQQIVFDREAASDPWENHFKSGESFVQSGSNLTLTLKHGGIVQFEVHPGSSNSYRATTYTAPNGDFIYFSWENIVFPDSNIGSRLTMIQNSRGHGVEFSYVNPSTTSGDGQQRSLIGRIDAIRTHCAPTNYQSCDTTQLPFAEYEYTNLGLAQSGTYPGLFNYRLTGSTASTGVEYSYEYDGTTFALEKVSQVGPPLTDLLEFEWEYDANGGALRVLSTTDANGDVSQYVSGPTATREFPDGAELDLNFGARMLTAGKSIPRGGASLQYHVLGRNAQPRIITDQLDRITVQNFDDRGRLTLTTYPSGLTKELSLDDRGNALSETITPSTTSSPANLVTSWVFSACTGVNTKVCNQPQSITDPKGNATSYQYDAQHGGLLKETNPAVDGIQPEKRYSYVSRTAYYENGSGQMVQAPQPIWLLASEEFCRTSATVSNDGCQAGSGDKVRTDYEYSPVNPSGPSNLVLTGVAVTADGQTRRTCYGYDVNGRRISETQPKAGLASCS